ncbi:tetratricopeptide repeat protein [Coraliomargarita algicola]|uniref:Tetratricopeptide repeat protein n=1 Tax=Coraliomargarita algicola TaxID=3092156 RepID=A0ABZ0RMN2_9BACT|nr:tetratricopeptide repeat protein [Coraliomargarita sp. J2-16]WPJ97484.1 tetratricopeptide repeat protein [Coraliomargarita sp. J2-16]
MKFSRRIPLYLVTILASILTAQADDFTDGLEAYHESKYAESAAAFERSLEQGESAATHHNLALSLFQQGKLAQAVWQLERAVRLAPTNQTYLYKLGALRQQLGLYKLPTTWWQSAANFQPQRTWMSIASICFWIIAAALIGPRVGGFRRPILLKLSLSFAVIVLTISTAALIIQSTQQASGVIISEEPTPLHHAPASAAPEAGIARPGERARILDQHNQFLKIKTEAKLSGWIPAQAFRKL